MKKYLVFAFLLGLTPFSFLNPIKAMEVDPEEEHHLNSVFTQPTYVVSLEEGAHRLSIADLRDQYPIDDMIHFGDLDSILYGSLKSGKYFIYNSFEEVEDAIEKLKLLAHTDSSHRLPCEERPLPHLFLAATNLLEGTHGMPQNRMYGAELMQWYLYETELDFARYYATILRQLSKENYSVENFLKDRKKIIKEQRELLPEKMEFLGRIITEIANEELENVFPLLAAKEDGHEILKGILDVINTTSQQ